jgi:cell division protein FtsW
VEAARLVRAGFRALMKAAVTTLACCVAALLTLGLVMLYSSSMNDLVSRKTGEIAGTKYLISQLVWCGIGVVVCVAAACLDYQVLKKFVLPIFILALLALVAVLVLPEPWAKPVKGARRWIHLPFGNVQPSEFAKLALILALAWYCDRYQRQMPTFTKGIVIPGGIIVMVLGLIFIEPDRGTTALLAAVSISMLLLAGVKWRFLIPPVLIGAVGFATMLVLDPMRWRRICSWLDLEETKDGVGYQAYQAMLALGSGGWFGLGLGNGRQKLGFVPERHTDFILSIIGEELGLVATLAVIIAFVMIVFSGIYIATHARDTFGTMLAAGITFLIGLQAVINIGVVTSALPNKGLALPFVSYGGSSLVAMLACVGLLFSIARKARAPELKPVNPFATDEFSGAQTT